ncbi:MAG: PAS domain S-box protein [Candidatus Yanofskybacteria bacterium]|nr:PAS domain S-box protein [Candidatus Yanofskybacteria bacterium]
MPIRIKFFLILLGVSLVPTFLLVTTIPDYPKSIFQPSGAFFLVTHFTEIVFVTLISLFVSAYFTLPITELRRLVQRVKSGQLTMRAQVYTTDEVGKLALEFNTMLDTIQKQIKDMGNVKARSEAILLAIGDGLVVVDREKKIHLVNKAFETLTGWNEKEVLGKLIYEVLPREDENGNLMPSKDGVLTRILGATTTTTTTTTTTWNYIRKDKTKFPGASTISTIVIGGKIIGAVEVFRDITEEKELERSKTEFISIASHQLRTPVSGLNWLTEALRSSSQNLNEKQTKYVGDLYTFSKRLTELIENLLDFSRIELKAKTEDKSPIEIVRFIEDFMGNMKLYADSKNHKIIFNKKMKDQLIVGISSRALYNVLQNLVSNAIDYSPGDKSVTIDLEGFGDFIKVSVCNNGPTISKEDRNHIFGRFYRTESAKKIKPEGTGLGLYVVKAVIEEAGGEVGFESEEGKDTVFWFTLPLKKAA